MKILRLDIAGTIMRPAYIYLFVSFFLISGCSTYKPAIKITYKPLGRSTYYSYDYGKRRDTGKSYYQDNSMNKPHSTKTDTIRHEYKQEYPKVQYPAEPAKKFHEAVTKKEPVRGYVNADRVRVRKGPSEEAHVLTHLNADTPVDIFTDNTRNGWVQVYLENPQVEGWIWSAYIDIPSNTVKTQERYRDDYSFAFPLREAVITDTYGVRRSHPVNGGRGRMHTGVDLRATYGTPVFAVSSGVVVAGMNDYYYGQYIDLDHGDGKRSRYAHLSKPLVRVGTHVDKGERIALTGDSGQTTGPHLHFELWINGQVVDPADYIKFSR